MASVNGTIDVENIPLYNLNWSLAAPLLPIDIVLGIYFVVGIVGNATVTYVYGFKLKVKWDNKFFILVMAVVDTIVCLTGPIFSLIRNIYPIYFLTADSICKMAWFFVRVMNGFSGMLILVIGIERYLKVCRRTGKQMTKGWKKVALVIAFVMTVVLHTPLFVFYGIDNIPLNTHNITGYRCGLLHGQSESFDLAGKVFLYFMFASAVLAMVLICIFYGMTGYTIYAHLRKMKKLPDRRPSLESSTSQGLNDYSSKEESTANSSFVARSVSQFRKKSSTFSVFPKRNPLKYHRYTIMFLIISLVCVITYVPALASNLAVDVDSVQFWNTFSDSQRNIYLFVFQFYLLNHVVNPIIYACFDSKFRAKLLNLFKR